MICNFRMTKENISKVIIDKFGNRKEIEGQEKFFLKNENGSVLSNYYDGIIYLGKDYFAVATYDSHIVKSSKFKNGVLVESKISASNITLKWGIIKIYRDEFGDIISRSEDLIVPFIYDSILPNNNNTASASYDNKYTYLELDETKENYSEQLFPCVFQNIDNFDLVYKNFAKVRLGEKNGYISRNVVKNNSDISLLDEQEVVELSRYFNEKISDLNFDTRYKYMCLTNETPALTRILKNNSKN